MREILFRGQRLDNGKWKYGYYFEREERAFIITDSIPVNEEVDCTPMHICAAEVIPETVGQFTGIKDKNGRKIFEGDIAVGASRTPHIIKIGRHRSEAMKIFLSVCAISEKHYEYGAYAEGLNGIQCNIEENNIIEVIGNIYDNPELLKD